MDSKTLRLIETIRSGRTEDSIDDLLICAKENKMLLQLLRSAKINGPLRERQESQYREVMQVVGNLAEAFREIDYALIKFIKAAIYVPSDVDFLVATKDIPKASCILQKHGYREIVREPYCLTFKRSLSIDTYIHPCLANLVYLNGAQLLANTRDVQIDGAGVRSLSTSAEVVLVAAHSVYKEQLVTLNDCLTIQKWLDAKCIDLATETNTSLALSRLIELLRLLRTGQIELPYKLSLSEFLGAIGSKFISDRFTRTSAKFIVLKLLDPRLPSLIASKINRRTY